MADDSDESSSSTSTDEEAAEKPITGGYVLSIRVPEGRRQKFVLALMVTNFLAFNCGVIFCFLSWVVRASLEKQIAFLQDSYHPNAVPVMLFVAGLTAVAASLLGLKAAVGGRVLEDGEQAKKAAYFFKLSWAGALASVAMLFAVAVTCFAEISVLRGAFGRGLKDGMEKYILDINFKAEIDSMQLEYECCGSEGYKDWFTVAWIDAKFLENRNKDIQQGLKEGMYFGHDVPYSCCKRGLSMPCVDFLVDKDDAHVGYSYPKDLTIQKGGCTKAVLAHLGNSVFLGNGLFVFFNSLFWIPIAVLSRYLHTSLSCVAKDRDPVGWLVPYKKKGPTQGAVKPDED